MRESHPLGPFDFGFTDRRAYFNALILDMYRSILDELPLECLGLLLTAYDLAFGVILFYLYEILLIRLYFSYVWRKAEVSIPMRLSTARIVFKTSPEAARVNLPLIR